MSKKQCQSCKKTHVSLFLDKEIFKSKYKASNYSLLKDKLPELKNNIQNLDKLTTIHLGSKYKNRFIFFYGAKHSGKNCIELPNFNSAYNFSNNGVIKTNSKGSFNVYLKCPKSYIKMNKTYVSHVHFIISNKDNTNWDDNIYTKRIICELNTEELQNIIKTNCSIILNALPLEYFIKYRIPTSFPLSYKLELSKKEVLMYIYDLVSMNPKIKKKLDSKTIKLLDVPIITYCYDVNCNASSILVKKLLDMGFTNIREYPLGIKGWLKETKKN